MNLLLIANGVDISEIDAVTEVASEIVNLRTKGTFIIGYIGQLIHRKGLDVLFKAASKLPDTLKWNVVIVGEGDRKMELQDLVKELRIDRVSAFLDLGQTACPY